MLGAVVGQSAIQCNICCGDGLGFDGQGALGNIHSIIGGGHSNRICLIGSYITGILAIDADVVDCAVIDLFNDFQQLIHKLRLQLQALNNFDSPLNLCLQSGQIIDIITQEFRQPIQAIRQNQIQTVLSADHHYIIHIVYIPQFHHLFCSVENGLIVHQIEVRIGLFDNQGQNLGTRASGISFSIEGDKGNHHIVLAGIRRCITAHIAINSGSDSHIGHIKLALAGNILLQLIQYSDGTYCLGSSIIGVGCILCLNRINTGNNQHISGDGFRHIHLATNIQDIRDFGVSTHIQIFLTVGQDNLHSLAIYSKIQDLEGNCIALNAVYCSISTQIHSCQGIQRKDVIAVLIDPVQLCLIHIGVDNQNAGTHCGVVVRIGHNADDQICTDFLMGRCIMEGDSKVGVQLLQHISQGIEGIDINFHASFSNQCFQLCFNFFDSCDCACNGDTILISIDLGQQLICPVRQVNIDLACDSIQQIFAEGAVGADCGSNNCCVGVNAGVSGHMNHILSVDFRGIILMEHGIHVNLCLSGLNNHCANLSTQSYQSTLLINRSVSGSYHISTGMDGSLVAIVGFAISLHANIGDVQASQVLNRHTVNRNSSLHFMLLIIENEVTIIVLCTGLIHEGYHGGSRNDHERASNGICIIHYIAEILQHCQLGIQTIVKLRDILNRLAIRHSIQQEFTIIGKTEVQVNHFLSSCIMVSSVQEGLCLQVHILQSRPGEDAIVIPVFLKCQIDLRGIGHDDHNSRTNGGIMVEVGNHCNHQVCANLVVSNVIREGQVGVDGQLLHQIDNLVEGGGVHIQLFHCTADLIGVAQEYLRGNTICITCIQDAQLIHHAVHPVGQIHIYSTIDRIQTGDVIQVCRQASGNDGSVRNQTGNIIGRCVDKISDRMILAVPQDSIIVHSGLGLGRLNHQNADAGTKVNDTTPAITLSVLGSNLVSTCIDGCIVAGVRNAVGLNTHIEHSNTAILSGQIQNRAVHQLHLNDVHGMGLCIEFEVTLIVDIAIFIHEVDFCIIRHDDDFTGNGFCIIRSVA